MNGPFHDLNYSSLDEYDDGASLGLGSVTKGGQTLPVFDIGTPTSLPELALSAGDP